MLVTQAQFLIDHLDWVDHATQALKAGKPPLTLRQELEREFEADLCRALLDCADARIRFRTKLYQGERWLLTGVAAEQASAWQVARWRADRLSSLLSGQDLTEVGSGIGGDSVFLSRIARLSSYEQCPARSRLAAYNVGEFGSDNGFRQFHEAANLTSLSGHTLFCDPARRRHQRLSSPEEWDPALSQVLALLDQNRFRSIAVKCAPGLDVESLAFARHKLETTFLSLDGDLKECFLLAGQGVESSTKAVLLNSHSEMPEVYQNSGREIPFQAPAPGLYLHNPDPAVLRAFALDQLAYQLNAGQPHQRIGYLVGPKPSTGRAAQSFLIEDSFPLKWPDLKKRVASSGWTEFEYLGRGVPFSQTDLRGKLPKLKRGKGEPKRGSIIIFREEQGYRVVLATRVAAIEG